MSSSLKAALEVSLMLVTVLLNRTTLNSKNSSKPPSSVPNRRKQPRKKSSRSSGAQNGHNGTTLQKIDDPDEVEFIPIDQRTLPQGHSPLPTTQNTIFAISSAST